MFYSKFHLIRIHLIFITSLLVSLAVGCGGGGLTSGGSVSGHLDPDEVHTLEFEATVGSSIYLSVGSTMQTYFTVLNPDGTELASAYNSYLTHDVQQTGTYKVLLQTRYAGQQGDYVLHYANSMDANENGLLTSGGMHSADLTSNDIDSFTLDVSEGDSIHLSLDSTMQTQIHLFLPDGSLLQSSYNALHIKDLEFAGVYRLFVTTRYAFNIGDFDLHFVNGTTATEYGFLTSGAMHSADLTSNDLDTFQFEALAGDTVHVSIGSAMQTFMTIYNPDGSFLADGFNIVYIEDLIQDGDYRVVVQTRYAFNVGDYELHYMNSRTALEHGFLTSGAMHTENLTANDLDTFQFEALVGDTVHVSIGSTMQTYMRVFHPDGSFLAAGYNGVYLEDLAQEGDYRVIVQTRYAFNTGDYELHFVNARTTSEHGSLPSQGTVTEDITSNDLDSYVIDIATGDDLTLSATGDIPVAIYLYQPNGMLIGSGRDGYQFNDATESGTYSVVVSAFYAFQTGAYSLTTNITQ